MFKRRVPLTKLQSLRELLWPSMGWWRVLKFYLSRIIRLSSPAHSIAANLAGGAAMSFTPFFGIHVFTAMGFAWAIGAGPNIVAAMVGTFVGNPWTFPFLFFAAHFLGSHILALFGYAQTGAAINPDVVTQHADGMWAFLADNFNEIFIPTAIGGTILAILSWPLYYYLFFYLVRGAQRARKLRIRRKQMAAFKKSAKPPKELEDQLK
jgi:uncharacterized protein (DUF2062 family)